MTRNECKEKAQDEILHSIKVGITIAEERYLVSEDVIKEMYAQLDRVRGLFNVTKRSVK